MRCSPLVGGIDKKSFFGRLLEKKERKKMENVIITPSYTDYEKYFNDMSDALLSVWIEVAERRLPNYRSWSDIASVKIGLLAAKSVQEKREKIQ